MTSCRSFADQAAKFWREHEQVVTLLAQADPRASAAVRAAQAAEKMISKWNGFFGESVLHIGPRKLGFGKPVSGAVTGPTQRMWITARPTLQVAKVRIEKLDGKMKTRVTVCAHDAQGGHHQIRSFQTDSHDEAGSAWTAPIPKGCLVSVLITGRVGLNKFKYSVGIEESQPARSRVRS